MPSRIILEGGCEQEEEKMADDRNSVKGIVSSMLLLAFSGRSSAQEICTGTLPY